MTKIPKITNCDCLKTHRLFTKKFCRIRHKLDFRTPELLVKIVHDFFQIQRSKSKLILLPDSYPFQSNPSSYQIKMLYKVAGFFLVKSIHEFFYVLRKTMIFSSSKLYVKSYNLITALSCPFSLNYKMPKQMNDFYFWWIV